MTVTNHVLAGSLLVMAAYDVVPLWILLPVAFLLHFVLDATPHFGWPITDRKRALRNLLWILPIDATIAAGILLMIVIAQPQHWVWLAAGGILCASPDLFHIPSFVRFLRTGNPNPYGDLFSRFHTVIQWCERPWGIYVEHVVLAGLLTLLILNIK